MFRALRAARSSTFQTPLTRCAAAHSERWQKWIPNMQTTKPQRLEQHVTQTASGAVGIKAVQACRKQSALAHCRRTSRASRTTSIRDRDVPCNSMAGVMPSRPASQGHCQCERHKHSARVERLGNPHRLRNDTSSPLSCTREPLTQRCESSSRARPVVCSASFHSKPEHCLPRFRFLACS